jgi:hypothetical protein
VRSISQRVQLPQGLAALKLVVSDCTDSPSHVESLQLPSSSGAKLLCCHAMSKPVSRRNAVIQPLQLASSCLQWPSVVKPLHVVQPAATTPVQSLQFSGYSSDHDQARQQTQGSESVGSDLASWLPFCSNYTTLICIMEARWALPLRLFSLLSDSVVL